MTLQSLSKLSPLDIFAIGTSHRSNSKRELEIKRRFHSVRRMQHNALSVQFASFHTRLMLNLPYAYAAQTID